MTDARFHGLTQFSVYQGLWNAVVRDFERDILPMCEAEGMGLAPWGALGRGMFKTAEQYNAADREGRKMGQQDPRYAKTASKLEEIAKKKGTEITSVALAYVMHKAPYVFPIVGGRKVDHLKGNIEALGVQLSQEEVDEIEDVSDFDIGFPLGFLFGYGGQQYRTRLTSSDMFLVQTNTNLESVPKPTVSHGTCFYDDTDANGLTAYPTGSWTKEVRRVANGTAVLTYWDGTSWCQWIAFG